VLVGVGLAGVEAQGDVAESEDALRFVMQDK